MLDTHKNYTRLWMEGYGIENNGQNIHMNIEMDQTKKE